MFSYMDKMCLGHIHLPYSPLMVPLLLGFFKNLNDINAKTHMISVFMSLIYFPSHDHFQFAPIFL